MAKFNVGDTVYNAGHIAVATVCEVSESFGQEFYRMANSGYSFAENSVYYFSAEEIANRVPDVECKTADPELWERYQETLKFYETKDTFYPNSSIFPSTFAVEQEIWSADMEARENEQAGEEFAEALEAGEIHPFG